MEEIEGSKDSTLLMDAHCVEECCGFADDATYDDIKLQIENCVLSKEEVLANAKDVDKLVFEGGGVRGIAFGGSLRFLEEHKILQQIKSFAGSSAGAIVATAVAIGFTSQEIIDVLQRTDFDKFKDDSWGVVLDLLRLLTQYGIYKGDAFYKWFANLLKEKTGNADITFQQIYEQYGTTLVITGTCLNKAKTFYFNRHNPDFANMPVAFAVRASMSIPLFWKAVKYQDDLLVDGGVLNNFPIYCFDGKCIGDPDVTDEQTKNSTTIGLKLMTESEKADSLIYHQDTPIGGPIDYAKAFLNAMLIQIERGYIRGNYWNRTVCINTHDISSLDFHIDNDKKMLLVHEGYIATKNFFYCRMNGIDNDMNKRI